MKTRAVISVLCLLIGMTVFVCAVLHADEADRAIRVRSLGLWMTDCSKAIEACAADWDHSPTLRQIYLARAKS